MTALDRARDDLANDRAWKARDRVAGRLCNVCDVETMTLLAEIHLHMKDYPAAGAMFFALGADDATARRAISAWEVNTPDPLERWRSLPRMVRVHETDRVRVLRESVGQDRPELRQPQPHWRPGPPTWDDRLIEVGCGLLVLMVIAVFIVGLATIAVFVATP
ncbi:hypothetical protein Back2_05580 [Nocardioides baekrokdamisoli]|uniref:Uncharacterized protein n=1 Tax=Nocardioides baekrokdamisoli TaxID=1804624 RepID=A0A3G9IRL7_9ACTN|nr:DUF6584 family protein [Nocardioides baekrokdamisoli]BBH16271.1 hypothetical protein Back2_05580 [Nocardioides baekrokdamisoli]